MRGCTLPLHGFRFHRCNKTNGRRPSRRPWHVCSQQSDSEDRLQSADCAHPEGPFGTSRCRRRHLFAAALAALAFWLLGTVQSSARQWHSVRACQLCSLVGKSSMFPQQTADRCTNFEQIC